MNIKKYLLTLAVAALSLGAFAYPAPQEEDPAAQLLEQYTAQMQELQKSFDKDLLAPLKAITGLALQAQEQGQTELTPQQEELFTQYTEKLDAALTKLVTPALKDIDMAQFNQQYKQAAQTYGLPAQEFTTQQVAELLKALYLMSAVAYFEQNKKLTQDEAAVIAEILFSQEEEEQ